MPLQCPSRPLLWPVSGWKVGPVANQRSLHGLSGARWMRKRFGAVVVETPDAALARCTLIRPAQTRIPKSGTRQEVRQQSGRCVSKTRRLVGPSFNSILRWAAYRRHCRPKHNKRLAAIGAKCILFLSVRSFSDAHTPCPLHSIETTARPFLPHPRHRSRPLRSRTFAAGLSPTLSSASGVNSATGRQRNPPSGSHLARDPRYAPQ
jgi:hypothetical protein